MSPDRYCLDKAAPRGADLYYALRFLDPKRRPALAALYALRIELLETARQCQDPAVARAKLHWWREELAGLFAGRPSHPISHALVPALKRYNLPQDYFRELVDGAEMDLDYDAYPSLRELSLYCHRTGSVVGLLGAEIQGFQDRSTVRFAHDLGMARVLLERLLGVREQARRGRFYIPEDELAHGGVSHGDLLGVQTTERVRALFHQQAERIRAYSRRALTALPAADFQAQRGHRVLAALDAALLDEIEAEGYRLLEQRTTLTALRKLWIAWRTVRRKPDSL